MQYHLKLMLFRFWEAVQELRALPQSQVNRKASEIWSEYLAEDASCPVNIDSHSMELTKKNMENPDRWTFDAAAVRSYYKSLINDNCATLGSCVSPYEKRQLFPIPAVRNLQGILE